MALILQAKTEHLCPLQVRLWLARTSPTGGFRPPSISTVAPLSASVCTGNGSWLAEFLSHQFVNSHAFEGRKRRVETRNTNPIFLILWGLMSVSLLLRFLRDRESLRKIPWQSEKSTNLFPWQLLR